ncbi:FtsW/RodA/SpoVE family cell cycle protein [Estrella lausannensis]|uniref:Septum-peptidoglycan biosynthetic protein n=1 Tax=Estrella lausannensis TaxID=483423 RepID=A0A0H5DQX5_9BACT|nr:FtsW/RodA/SpoVE family cell cycle protein [Estrella lausannensis]CRX38967.1 Septum-peptidoglycan biosynthetic protein [Estrella lausannensis]
MWWNPKLLMRLDFRVIPIIFALMLISLLVISSYSEPLNMEGESHFFTTTVLVQIQWFAIGWLLFLFFAGFDYNKLREWTWFLYALMIVLLVGLFFTDPIQRVHRWYKVPFIGASLQPSEYAKIAVVITLSWFLERKKHVSDHLSTAFQAFVITGIPFLLIFKQPDLGTALVLFPITLVMFYFGGAHPFLVRVMSYLGLVGVLIIAVIFLNIVPHQTIKPYALNFLKEYQFDRLDPNTPHQKAAQTAIAVGGVFGTGFKKSEFVKGGWLPAPFTDSVFPAFGEEFGLLGLLLILALLFALIYCSFQVSAVAKDHFGRLLSAGIAVLIAMHVIVNIGMMSGFLPITGVPLTLITYGGSSVLSTMTALGVLQSVYSRRFMF